MASMPNHDQIIVVTENKRRKGLIWAAAGAVVLVAGGSTFALWSAQDTFSGGTITAGDLNITQLAETSFWDVSNDRKDAVDTVGASDGSQLGHLVDDVNTWRIAPGDKLAASFEATATLDGDNLVARLGVDGLDQVTSAISGISYSYEVYYGDQLLVSETALPADADAPLLYLSAPGTGQDAGLEDASNGILGDTATVVTGVAAQSAVFGMPKTTADLNVVIYASFYNDANGDFRYQATDGTVSDRTDVKLADTLADLTVSLEQVRDTGVQFN
ncbi:alternate signal-mediated exported protein, RER_14450 family [Arthrobacter alpinus]|uniref:Alternate signal-mediated exported protein, RER_14450 family n=1 Tax=Arthrobacter alpinus TaxID=656366 RepID=A0A1H5PFV8_9MICC|nr:alternate-type signal peptide domain-containing protein [Arthrobacter alpinus]SEF12623.1 alternate signal-mediated exported protein, RER_14450 family [Arthrobacter alpinus]SEF12630.1 alternate signal-mediated exported protein, RER_14450 family [Arthrobacter alpinus]